MTRFITAVHTTPVGEAVLVLTSGRLVALQIAHEHPERVRERLAHRLGAAPEEDDAATAVIARQLDEYFDGRRREFDIPLDWRLTRGFGRAALEAVRQIPYGQTAAYGEVAVMAGSPGAARAVGTACAATPFSIVVPVHRVVRADGAIGEYGGHPEVKRYLLSLEGAADG